MRFENEAGLLTFQADGANQCLGYLLHVEGHGVYDAELGPVDVTPEEARTHNQIFDAMMINGLDERCQVGQGERFYVSDDNVKTWLGTVLGKVSKVRSTYTLIRKGKKFVGKPRKGEEVCFFERVT